MDMMSDFDMPSLQERKQMLMEYAKTLKSNLDNVKLECLVSKIPSETKNYSLAGYSVYGKKDEFERLLNEIKS